MARPRAEALHRLRRPVFRVNEADADGFSVAQMSGDHFSIGKLARLLNETEAEDMRDLLKLLLLRSGRP